MVIWVQKIFRFPNIRLPNTYILHYIFFWVEKKKNLAKNRCWIINWKKIHLLTDIADKRSLQNFLKAYDACTFFFENKIVFFPLELAYSVL